MTLVLKDIRKVAVVGWDVEDIKGSTASLEVKDQEKRTVANDGESNLFFPLDFVGDVTVTVKGSHSGEDTATISVT